MPAEPLDRAIDDAPHALFLREVGAHGEHAIVAAGQARHVAGSRVERGLGPAAERYAAAFRGERLRAGQAESTTRSCDDRDFVLQSEVHRLCII